MLPKLLPIPAERDRVCFLIKGSTTLIALHIYDSDTFEVGLTKFAFPFVNYIHVLCIYFLTLESSAEHLIISFMC